MESIEELETALQKKKEERKTIESVLAVIEESTIPPVVFINAIKEYVHSKSSLFSNPKNKKQVWSGRGRTPKWFDDAIAEGITKESMWVER